MNIKTAELTGSALDWAVAKCEGIKLNEGNTLSNDCDVYAPSTDWSQGGAIIEREEISISREFSSGRVQWKAWFPAIIQGRYGLKPACYGETPLAAAMRCYVASKLGDEVDVPIV